MKITVDVVDLVLKAVRDECRKSKCDDCKFKMKDEDGYPICNLANEPHNWILEELEERGKEE